MDDSHGMRLAIETARQGIADGQSPFGAAVVKDGQVVAVAHNTVLRDTNPTAHAEINALRAAALVLKTIRLSGCTLYSSCEPCPMCLAAIHWAKVDRVVFGAHIEDASRAGFSELPISAKQMAELGRSPLRVEKGPLHDECAGLFREWQQSGSAQPY
jgi:tRNA(Arg) A34 adenosine deaminase TadA